MSVHSISHSPSPYSTHSQSCRQWALTVNSIKLTQCLDITSYAVLLMHTLAIDAGQLIPDLVVPTSSWTLHCSRCIFKSGGAFFKFYFYCPFFFLNHMSHSLFRLWKGFRKVFFCFCFSRLSFWVQHLLTWQWLYFLASWKMNLCQSAWLTCQWILYTWYLHYVGKNRE